MGYEEGGYLTELVRRKPYAVILFDEVEKAHPDVFNVLLQVLDDGRLTDGQGRTVDFKNTVIIMTSNLGSQMIQEMSSRNDYDAMKEAVMEIAGTHFRPEFMNRIDDMIVFHPLLPEQLGEIAKIQISRLAERLNQRDMKLVVADEALHKLAATGFDPVYGARPLKRVIQTALENKIAHEILGGNYMPGDIIRVTVEKGEIAFRVSDQSGHNPE